MRKHLGMRRFAAAGLAAVATTALWASTLHASDHSESPLVQKDAAQDITDVYVFGGPQKITIIVCWAGLSVDPKHKQGLGAPASTEGLYDPAALYTIHIDTNGDNKEDHLIHFRFGKNGAGDTGVQWSGLPGAEATFSHAVETVYNDPSGARTWAGHADDPFFFDAQGYLDTLATGKLSFDHTRDTLAGLNVTAAAIEIDTTALGNGPIQVWATSGRKGS